MAYTKTTWTEYTGTGAQKVTGMNNMETQYDEVVSYYTATLHDASYYTEAEAASMFFAPTYDGTGSGFVAETLDGYSAATLLNMQVSAGTVAIWGSSEASIPTGWHLCDGRDANTPDLRGKFPTCAGNSYVKGATGGSATVSSSASAVTIGTHALTTGEMPSHSHGSITDHSDTVTGTQGSNGGAAAGYGGATSYTRTTTSSGSGTAHGHSGSSIAGGQGTTNNNLPAYRAYCYIVKE